MIYSNFLVCGVKLARGYTQKLFLLTIVRTFNTILVPIQTLEVVMESIKNLPRTARFRIIFAAKT